MPIDSLPDHPDIERLKGHAKTLRDLVRAGVDGSIDLVQEHHPRFARLAASTPAATGFKLVDAQLTIARHYGFASWPKLRQHIELINRLSRSPHEEPIGGDLLDDDARADELLRLACLNYGDDSAARRHDAARLLAAHPQLAAHSIFTAAAVGDVAATTAILARDRDAALRDGGPFRWPPLLYLTYSRLDRGDGSDAVAVARLLLEHGADPNAGFLWDGLPSPFTALTGVFGRGEQGAPPHRDELVLARLLLEAGAEPNDSQTIYNCCAGDIARDDTEFLELLFEFGLGRGDGGPWRRQLGRAHQSPGEVVTEALQHAAEGGLEQRMRLLLAHDVDPNRRSLHPIYKGRSPYEGAMLNGNIVVAELLAAAGAVIDTVTTLDRFVGACLAGDRAAVNVAVAADAQLVERARAQHGDLVARAAKRGRADAIRLLVELGFDIHTGFRATALHEAALRGHLATVMLLIELGADPTIVDTEFDATPAGWAEHGGHPDVVTYLNAQTSS